ncbi:MAG: hypothetical protein AB8G99_25440 [Planctomycetaceae bacterium]
MRKLLILMMAVAFAFCVPTQSKAEPGRWRRVYRPTRSFAYRPVRTQPGPLRQMFGNLMELEKRKNAWLASTFLGR